MTVASRIADDLKAAMKARDEVAKLTLRSLKSELMQKEIELGRPLDDKEEVMVLSAAVKSRRDAIAQYEEGGRPELADNERAEIEVLQRYLPAPLSDDEARAAMASLAAELGATSKKDMGKLMKAFTEAYRGRYEGKAASRLAAEILG
ncbi:MAG: GatB/YqeY domain-containing protein [Sandaracinaceae bacterium]